MQVGARLITAVLVFSCHAWLAPLCALLIPFVASLSDAAADQPATDARIDLSHWKLTLPVDAASSVNGKASEVPPAELRRGSYTSDFFHIERDGSLVFWCPVNGARTEGTKFPRTELREMLDPERPQVNWSPAGSHVISARCQVRQVPGSQKVIIGQIHTYSGKALPLIKLQFYKGRVEALVKMSPNKDSDRKLKFADVGLNANIDYQLRLRDGVLDVTVNGNTQTVNIFEIDAVWAKQTFYFKAGAYPQDNDGPPTEGARVAFSRLTVNHANAVK